MTNWTYQKPTKTGLYLMNNGDVVTSESMEPVEIKLSKCKKYLAVHDLDGGVTPLESIGSAWKYLYLNELAMTANTY